MAVRNISKKQKLNSFKDNGRQVTKVISIILSITLFLVILWDVAGPYGFWKLYHLRHKRDIVFKTNIELDKENQKLQNTITRLKTDPSFQELWIRKNLGWVKDNELLFIFISNNSD